MNQTRALIPRACRALWAHPSNHLQLRFRRGELLLEVCQVSDVARDLLQSRVTLHAQLQTREKRLERTAVSC